MTLKDVLTQIGIETTAQAKINLHKKTPHGIKNRSYVSVSSGRLEKSITYKVSGTEGEEELNFDMLPYGYWVDEGRKPGPISKEGTSELIKWMKRRRIDMKYLYVIKRSIERRGYNATHFFTNAFNDNAADIDAAIDRWVDIQLEEMMDI